MSRNANIFISDILSMSNIMSLHQKCVTCSSKNWPKSTLLYQTKPSPGKVEHQWKWNNTFFVLFFCYFIIIIKSRQSKSEKILISRQSVTFIKSPKILCKMFLLNGELFHLEIWGNFWSAIMCLLNSHSVNVWHRCVLFKNEEFTWVLLVPQGLL